MRLDRVIADLAPVLSAAGVDGAARDLRILAAHVLGVSRDRVGMHLGDDMHADAVTQLRALAQSRAAGRPVSRLIGQRAFWGRDFMISDAVLDPRPETETLIAAALEDPAHAVLDLGTGSGVIAITLAAEWAGARVTASDLSPEALEVARANAARHGVAERMQFHRSDWYRDIAGQFDLIVSNPPYIARNEMEDLAREVAEHDPRMALTDEGDGLGAYRHITAGAADHLTPGGRLMVEIGWQQGSAVRDLFAQAGFSELRIVQDFDGRDRVVCGKCCEKCVD